MQRRNTGILRYAQDDARIIEAADDSQMIEAAIDNGNSKGKCCRFFDCVAHKSVRNFIQNDSVFSGGLGSFDAGASFGTAPALGRGLE
ncbi:hypothetical protein HDF08_003120 [Edaphobacter lichenicola]|uniref:Uncharacterized protein n=1 Tax=Tunturiibacter lichenicola TaxID=2051959 RepID=A0A852VDQ7_9BACT|nr:hypothetical protein [Edaphobacter lichenicola]